MKKLAILFVLVGVLGAFALDEILITNTSTRKTTRTSSPTLTTVTATTFSGAVSATSTLNLTVTTASATAATGSIYVPMKINGVTYNLLAN